MLRNASTTLVLPMPGEPGDEDHLAVASGRPSEQSVELGQFASAAGEV